MRKQCPEQRETGNKHVLESCTEIRRGSAVDEIVEVVAAEKQVLSSHLCENLPVRRSMPSGKILYYVKSERINKFNKNSIQFTHTDRDRESVL